ncbi:hypothetical protein KSX_92490 [Ktedonospora formicarum]|uniref:Uncharacterized protein n=1 Tax=Ktedonospora formicarum TaxID=2778364 RepID=A0A8J3MYL9_9CHLR|nr:hypothetical protein KSX_92490 [Ktedonospora formicarum]
MGGLVLHAIAVTQLGWIGEGCTLLAILLLFISLRLNKNIEQMPKEHIKETAPKSE